MIPPGVERVWIDDVKRELGPYIGRPARTST